jgi:hypothetical protein
MTTMTMTVAVTTMTNRNWKSTHFARTHLLPCVRRFLPSILSPRTLPRASHITTHTMPRKNAAAAAVAAASMVTTADEVIRRPGITPSGLPGGDVNSPFIRGAPRNILIRALDFMRGAPEPHRARKILPLVAVSSIFTSTGPYLVNGRGGGTRRIFSLLARHLSTFRFITHVNLDFVRRDGTADGNVECIDEDLSMIDRVLRITLGRRSFSKLQDLEKLFCDGSLPYLQAVEANSGSLYRHYWRTVGDYWDHDDSYLAELAKRLLAHPTLSVRTGFARMFAPEGFRTHARNLDGYFLETLMKTGAQRLKAPDVRVDDVVSHAHLICTAMDALRYFMLHPDDEYSDPPDFDLPLCEELAQVAQSLLLSSSRAVQEAAMSLLQRAAYELLSNRYSLPVELTRLLEVTYADGETFLRRIGVRFVHFVENELPSILAASSSASSAVLRHARAELFGPLHLIEALVYEFDEEYLEYEYEYERSRNKARHAALQVATKTLAELRVHETLYRLGCLKKRGASGQDSKVLCLDSLFTESLGWYDGIQPSDDFHVVLGKLSRASPQVAIERSGLPRAIAHDLQQLADGMLRHSVADLEHTDRGFTHSLGGGGASAASTNTRASVHVQEVQRFIERCNLVLELFFVHDYLSFCVGTSLALTDALEVKNANAQEVQFGCACGCCWPKAPEDVCPAFLQRRDLFFPPRVLEAVGVAFRVLHQERLRAIRFGQKRSEPFWIAAQRWMRRVFEMAALEKRVLQEAIEERAASGRKRGSRRRGRVDDAAVAVDVASVLRFQRVLDEPIVQRFVEATESELKREAARVEATR